MWEKSRDTKKQQITIVLLQENGDTMVGVCCYVNDY